LLNSLGPQHTPFMVSCAVLAHLSSSQELFAKRDGSTPSRCALGREAWMNDCAVSGERRRFHNLVVPIDRERFRGLVHQDFEEGEKVPGVEARSGRGDA